MSNFKISFSTKQKDSVLKPPQSKLKSTQSNGGPPAKRARLALDDDEPEDKQESVEISGWDAATGGAIDLNGKKEDGPRVIPALPNQWHAVAKAKAGRAREGKGEKGGQAGPNTEELKDVEIAYGLTVAKKKVQDEDGQEVQVEEMIVEVDDGLTEEQRLEKRALDALVNGKTTDTAAVIPQQTEQEAFEHDYANAPDAPSLDAYEATPIDGFGAALLRGMGWKDGEEIGRSKNSTSKVKDVKRRPALLGIGAKEEAAAGIEFGEYGGKGKGKGSKKKIDQVYNPIVMRNKKTGEMITEEELKGKIEGQELVPEKEDRGGKYDDEDERRARKRDERRDRDRRDPSEERSDRRDRDRRREDERHDSDRRRDRRREDERYDSDRRRDKRRDEDRYDSDRRRDKYRDDERDRRRDKRRDDEYYDSERKRDKYRERERRSRSPEGEDRRKRRREEYGGEREDRKRYRGEEKYRR